MNVFRMELRQSRTGLLVFSGIFVAMLFLYVPFVSLFLEQSAQIAPLFEGVDPALLEALGMDLSLLFSPLGFYGVLLTNFTLLAVIQAMSLGISLTSKEVQRKTADFLFTMPLPRTRIFSQKALSGIVVLLITHLCFQVVSFFLMQEQLPADLFDANTFLLLNFSLFLYQLLFFALGLFLGNAFARSIKSPLILSVGVCMGIYVFGMIKSILDLSWLSAFTLLQYFPPQQIVQGNGFSLGYLFLAVGITLFCGFTAYLSYTRKDIHAV